MTAEETIKVARGQLAKALGRLEAEPAGELDEAVHDVRKRIKKVRAYLKLARGAIRHKSIDKVDHRLRDAARPLSAIRDATALILALDQLDRRSAGLLPAGSFVEARAALVEHRAGLVRGEIVEGSALSKARKALRKARRRMEGWEPEGHGSEHFPGLKRSYKDARAAFEDASNDPNPEMLHEFRKRVKTFLYQLRTLKSAPGTPAARLQNLSSILADDLGEGHDLDVLRAFLKRLETSVPILVVLDRRRLDLRRGSLQRAAVIFRDKPRRFARALEGSNRPIEAARSDG